MNHRGVRAALVAAVLALHAAGAWLLAASRPAVRATATAPAAPVLRLRLLPAEPTPRATPPAPAQRPRPAAAAAAPMRRPPVADAITALPPEDLPALAALAARAASAPASAPPLDLRLPARQREAPSPAAAAAADPRANARARPARWEDRLAERLDTRVHETLQPDGRQRLRRGGDCLDLAPARIAQVDPWGQRDAPRTAAPCE